VNWGDRTGRWRSVYVVDYEKATIVGTISITVHYYEAGASCLLLTTFEALHTDSFNVGNVQMSTTISTTSPLSPSPTAASIIALIKTSEQTAQTQLAEAYNGLAEDTYKGLRRALPKTRSKIDWDKINAYRLRKELGGAVGVEV
jgi:capping protein alpha